MMSQLKQVLVIMLVATLSGCAGIEPGDVDPDDAGQLFAYMRVTTLPFTVPGYGAAGFYFYKKEYQTTRVGRPMLHVYEFRNQQLIDIVSTSNTEIFSEIEALGFTPFDFKEEVRAATEIIAESDPSMVFQVTADGVEWEIFIKTDQGDFLVRKWSPRDDILNLASYSENISKLGEYIRLLMRSYGEAKIRVL